MMTLIVQPFGAQAQVQKALDVLRNAGIKARKRSRALAHDLVQVSENDAERALELLDASNIRTSVRPN